MNKQLSPIFALIIITLLTTCKKQETDIVTKISTVSAVPAVTSVAVKGKIIELSSAKHAEYGFCYAEQPKPTVDDALVNMGVPRVGEFTKSISGLSMGTSYYFRAYCKEGSAYLYGEALISTTAGITVATADVTGISSKIATSGATITVTGGAQISKRGVCWGVSENPNLKNFNTADGSGNGQFTSRLTGLSKLTTYYIRGYAIAGTDTIYGNQKNFTTLNTSLPILETSVVSQIAQTTAQCGGNITSDGDDSIFIRGVCWSTNANPTADLDTKTTDGADTGTFVSSITGLTSNTAYHVRAYATNAVGTAYGTDVFFSTLLNASTNVTATAGNAQAIISFTAPAGNGGAAITGYTVTSNPGGFTGSGAASPITVTGLSNGTAYTFTVTATNANGSGPPSSASNSVTPSTIPDAPIMGTATKGNAQAKVTFTAPAGNGGSTITGYTVTSSPGGIKATGSASPITVTGLTNGTIYTFTVTATNVNGISLASSASNSVTPSITTTVPDAPIIGTATKGNAQATVTFTAPVSNGGSAITGYTATSSPGGFTGTASASPITVTGLSNGTAYTFTLTATNANGISLASSASNSVTPSTVPGAPTIGTATAGNAQAFITFTAPVSNGGSAITGYTVTSNPGGFTGTASASPITVTGLSNGTAYTFTVTATNDNGISLASAPSNPVTPSAITGITDLDGNSYSSVTIGTQTWMAENLKTTKYNDNTDIPLVADAGAWSALSTPGYCWYNNEESTYKTTYGALYNWYTINTGKLCPAGWHVPTDAEWKTLEMYLGLAQADADASGWRGTNQGTQLKNATGWGSGNGTNTRGFSALPGGVRYSIGAFYYIGSIGCWWSSTVYGTYNAWFRKLVYSNSSVSRDYSDGQSGFSVRCLGD